MDSSGHLKKDDSSATHSAMVHGTIALIGESVPSGLVSIYSNCDGIRTFAAFADSKGSFSFNPEILTTAGKPRECVVLADYEGYRSKAAAVSLVNPKSDQKLENLMLRPFAADTNALVSLNDSRANKAARKEHEKALNQAAKGDLSNAVATLRKATSNDPDYSSAWLSLGKLLENKGDRAGAQASFSAAIRADRNFAPPLIRLAALDAARSDWRATLDHSQRAIDLNPAAFPDAYALNAMANLSLQNIEAAEKSAREGLKLDVEQQYPELEYALGNVLFSQNEPDQAATHLRLYLRLSPHGSNAAIARDELAQTQAQSSLARTSSESTRDQSQLPNPATPSQPMPSPSGPAGPAPGLLRERNAPLLVRTPDHTCLETISREQIDVRGRPHDPELFRVEVAVSGDKEIYGSVDGKRFSNGRLADMLGPTFSTTGLFSSIARGLVAGNNANVSFAGAETLRGESVYRYNFRVPSTEVGWSLQYGKESGQAGEEGWFLLDQTGLVLRRIAVHAVGIPSTLKLSAVDAVIDYEPVTIADRRVLLPRMAQVRVEEGSGTKRVSQMFFHHCRAFAVESTLSFDAAGKPPDGNPPSRSQASLPPDLDVVVSLPSPITLKDASASDLLTARVADAVIFKGRKIIESGANIEGHVLPRRGENGVIIELDRVQTRTGWSPFYARLVSLSPASQLGVETAPSRPFDADTGNHLGLTDPQIPGVAKVKFANGSTGLAGGTQMTWKTELPEAPTGSRAPQLKTSVSIN
jgi:tetratricopeptide (TPR) repeat protein